MSVKHSNTEHDSSSVSKEEISLNVEENPSENSSAVTKEEISLNVEENPSETTNSDNTEVVIEETVVTRIELPEPDTENITVLSHKLPNTPILPWNHYDSPWEEQENPEHSETLPQEKAPLEEE